MTLLEESEFLEELGHSVCEGNKDAVEDSVAGFDAEFGQRWEQALGGTDVGLWLDGMGCEFIAQDSGKRTGGVLHAGLWVGVSAVPGERVGEGGFFQVGFEGEEEKRAEDDEGEGAEGEEVGGEGDEIGKI